MSLASPADDSVLELSRPLSVIDEDDGEVFCPMIVLSPLYTVVTELSWMCATFSPPLVVDMSTRFSYPLRFTQMQLPYHNCEKTETNKRLVSFYRFIIMLGMPSHLIDGDVLMTLQSVDCKVILMRRKGMANTRRERVIRIKRTT